MTKFSTITGLGIFLVALGWILDELVNHHNHEVFRRMEQDYQAYRQSQE